MGTNFYSKRIPTEEEIKIAKEKLEEHLRGKEDSDIFEYIESLEDCVHLGKRSGGWQFLWHYQPKHYQDNLDSIINFLKSPDRIIFDEYGEKFTFEEFLINEIGEYLYSGYTAESWDREHPKERQLYGENDEWISKDKLRFQRRDFS